MSVKHIGFLGVPLPSFVSWRVVYRIMTHDLVGGKDIDVNGEILIVRTISSALSSMGLANSHG